MSNMKISISDDFPFFQNYHDNSYIESHDCRKIVSLKENGRTYVLENDTTEELIVYHIDGGLIRQNDMGKCDYGIYSEKNNLILVELKGSDYNHACGQLVSTIECFQKSGVGEQSLFARIVLSKGRVPATRSTNETKLKKLLKEGSRLKSSSLKMQEQLSKLK